MKKIKTYDKVGPEHPVEIKIEIVEFVEKRTVITKHSRVS